MNAHKWFQRLLRGALGWTLAALLFWPALLLADSKLQPADVKTAKAVDLLAERLTSKDIDGAKFLENSVGFPPPDAAFSRYEWRGLAPKFQLQVALLAAVEAGESPGKMLAMLSRDLAHQDPTLRQAPELHDYFKLEVGLSEVVKFKLPKPPAPPELSKATHQKTAVLGLALRRPGQGGPHAALQRYLKLAPQKAVAAWLDAGGDLGLALEVHYARLKVKGEDAEGFLDGIKRDAVKRDRSLAFDKVLWNKGEEPPAPPAASLKPSGDPPPNPPVPAELQARAREKIFEDFKKQEYQGPQDRKFERMKGSMRGVGGILFGEKVSADAKLPALKSLTYEKGKDAASGVLWFGFKDGTRKRLDHVHAEDAWVAYQMVFGAQATPADEGYPLLGMTDNASYYEFGPDAMVTGRRNTVTMHPALHNTQLGWAAVRIDCLPESRAWLLAEVNADRTLKTREQKRFARQSLDWLFDPWREVGRRYPRSRSSIYRIVDVPLRVQVEGGHLVVLRPSGARPQGNKQAWPESLRRTGFIEMQVLVQERDALGKPTGKPVRLSSFTEESYQAVPELLRISYEFRRLNNFAAVLAAVRWAKGQGAAFAKPEAPKDPPATPDAVAVTAKAIKPIERYKPLAVLEQDRKNLSSRLTELLKTKDGKAYQQLEKDLGEAVRAYRKAKAGSADRDKAEKTIRDMEGKMEQLARKSRDVAYALKLSRTDSLLRLDIIGHKVRALEDKPAVANYRKVADGLKKARRKSNTAKPESADAKAAQKEIKDLQEKLKKLGTDSQDVKDYRMQVLFKNFLELEVIGADLRPLLRSPDVLEYIKLETALGKARQEHDRAKPQSKERRAAQKQIDDLRAKMRKLARISVDVSTCLDLLFYKDLVERDLKEDA
jgi:hypothetical protein